MTTFPSGLDHPQSRSRFRQNGSLYPPRKVHEPDGVKCPEHRCFGHQKSLQTDGAGLLSGTGLPRAAGADVSRQAASRAVEANTLNRTGPIKFKQSPTTGIIQSIRHELPDCPVESPGFQAERRERSSAAVPSFSSVSTWNDWPQSSLPPSRQSHFRFQSKRSANKVS